MVGAGAFGGDQQEDDVDRPLVDRIEVDRMGEPGEHAARLGERAHAAVRDGDAAADAGRAQPLTLQEAVEQATLVELQHGSGAGRQLCQQSLLAGRFNAGQNGVRTGQQIGNFHNVTNRLANKGQNSPGARRRPYRRLVRPGQAAWATLSWSQSAGPVRACEAMAALGTVDGRLRPMPRRPSRRRSADEGMRMASRYLATVRRAISMPSPFKRSTMRSSDR